VNNSINVRTETHSSSAVPGLFGVRTDAVMTPSTGIGPSLYLQSTTQDNAEMHPCTQKDSNLRLQFSSHPTTYATRTVRPKYKKLKSRSSSTPRITLISLFRFNRSLLKLISPLEFRFSRRKARICELCGIWCYVKR
jgi:hypothetical protein